MFDLGAGELLVVGVVALVAIGPKDLPRAIRAVGKTIGRIRGIASDFRHNIDVLAREAELKEAQERINPPPAPDMPVPPKTPDPEPKP